MITDSKYPQEVWEGVSEEERKKIEQILVDFDDLGISNYVLPLDHADFRATRTDMVSSVQRFKDFQYFDEEEEQKIQWEKPKYSEADLRDLLYHLLTLEPVEFMTFRNRLLDKVPVNRALRTTTNLFIDVISNKQRLGYGNIGVATKSWEKALKMHSGGNQQSEQPSAKAGDATMNGNEKITAPNMDTLNTDNPRSEEQSLTANLSVLDCTVQSNRRSEPPATIYNDLHCLRILPNSHPQDTIQFFRRIPNSLARIGGNTKRMNINFSLKTHNVEIAKQLRDLIIPQTDKLFTELYMLNTWEERKSRIAEFITAMKKAITECVEEQRKPSDSLELERKIFREKLTRLSEDLAKSMERVKDAQRKIKTHLSVFTHAMERMEYLIEKCSNPEADNNQQ